MPSEKSTNRCAKCGAELLGSAIGGLCPACLFEDSLQSRAPTIKVNPGTQVEVGPLGLSIGDRIGRYKLIEEIGEGGFGAVYLAEQEEPVRRRVALKVIKLGMDTRQVVARFEAERQALALMDHPNIAKVLDGGATDAGRPYFVMELVRGIRITDYCDQNNLATRERLGLFNQVCQAIQHAHQKGIIHRDIKPSNILVTLQDGQAVPKVIDFGIAKATDQQLTDKTLFTALHQFMGTPAYMSPEQAERTGLDIDTRSDIYSLGVLLYELLTGKTPFDAKELMAAGLEAMRRTIREQEPVRPSTRLNSMQKEEQTTTAKRRHTEAPKLAHLLAGDLDWIVMKALEKDRTRRYETANGFGADIQRHLNNEPVLARPVSNLYRFQKLVRRNKMAVGAVSAVAAALIVGLGLSTWLFLKERGTRQRAVTAEQTQSQLRQKAETEAGKSQQVAQFLKDMLDGVGPSVALGRDTKLLKEILDRTAKRIGKDLTNQPEVEAELRITLAQTYFDLGLIKESEQMARKTLALGRARLGEAHPAVAAALTSLCHALGRLGQLDEAERFGREAVDLWRKLRGSEDRDLASALNGLAVLLEHEGKYAEAELAQREVVAIIRKVSGNEDPDLGMLINNLALVLRQQAKLPEAEAMQREALKMQRKTLGPEHPEVALSLNNLGSMLSDQGNLVEAEATYRQALEMRKKVQGDDHPDVGNSLNNIGSVLRKQGKLGEAEAMHRQALALQLNRLGAQGPDVAKSLNYLAVVLVDQLNLAEAECFHREALELRIRLFGKENPAVITSFNNLGSVLREQGRLQEAESMHFESLAICRRVYEAGNRDTAEALNNLAVVRQRQGSLEQAEAFIREALEMHTKLLGAGHPDVATSLSNLGAILVEERRPAEAEAMYRQALTIRRKRLGDQHLATANSVSSLAGVLRDLNRFAEAEPFARESLAIFKLKGPDLWQAFSARSLLGDILLLQKKLPEAEPFLLEGASGLLQREEKIPLDQKPRLKESIDRLVLFYDSTSRPDQAGEWKKKLTE